MSTIHVIVCRTCGSYRTEQVPVFRLFFRSTERFRCAACGDQFDIRDFDTYVKKYPPNIERHCFACDQEGVQLVERNHREPSQPEDEIVDLYECTLCGQKFQITVQVSPDAASG